MENEELREKQRIEVIERLKILQKYYMLHQNVLKDFKADNTIYYSETINRF